MYNNKYSTIIITKKNIVTFPLKSRLPHETNENTSKKSVFWKKIF